MEKQKNSSTMSKASSDCRHKSATVKYFSLTPSNTVCDPQAFKAQSMMIVADVLSSLCPAFLCVERGEAERHQLSPSKEEKRGTYKSLFCRERDKAR